eukprot:12430347-Karenia_brevis.AAC.2
MPVCLFHPLPQSYRPAWCWLLFLTSTSRDVAQMFDICLDEALHDLPVRIILGTVSFLLILRSLIFTRRPICHRIRHAIANEVAQSNTALHDICNFSVGRHFDNGKAASSLVHGLPKGPP